MNILITGARGTIGCQLIKVLQDEHNLRLLSRSPVADDKRWRQVDITQMDSVVEVMQGMDARPFDAVLAGAQAD